MIVERSVGGILMRVGQLLTRLGKALENGEDASKAADFDAVEADADYLIRQRHLNRDVVIEHQLPSMVAIAREEYRHRRRRAEFLDPDLLAEPGWDMLLDLFISAESGKRISVTSLCVASAVPATTALRWIAVLEGQGLVERTQARSDGRVNFIDLTPDGMKIMQQILLERIRERTVHPDSLPHRPMFAWEHTS